MNNKNIFLENNIETINDLFKFMQNKFCYGWVDKNGNHHEGVNDAKTYSLQSPEELMKSKVGICWDMTELARSFFKNMTNLKFETYYLFYDDDSGCPSHSILVFYKDSKVYWFEPMLQDENCYYSGIHEYSNIEKLLDDFQIRFIKISLFNHLIPKSYNRKRFYLYRYQQPNYHINGYQMRNHIDHSTLINIKGEKL